MIPSPGTLNPYLCLDLFSFPPKRKCCNWPYHTPDSSVIWIDDIQPAGGEGAEEPSRIDRPSTGGRALAPRLPHGKPHILLEEAHAL